MVDKRFISLFLTFGYIPDQKLKFEDLEVFRLTDKKNNFHKWDGYNSLEESIKKGTKILRETFEDLADLNKTHVIPLSGGLDSRAILGGLLELGLRDNIIAVTFGTPGTLDYDIGKYIAEKLEVKHEAIDLSNINVDQEGLIKTAKSNENWTWLMDSFYNNLIYNKFGKDVVYWSGFMGGEITGGALFSEDSITQDQAIKNFIKKNMLTKYEKLISPDISIEEELNNILLTSNSRLCLDEQLNYGIRQENYIKSVVVNKAYDVKLPYLSNEWLKFTLNAPREFKEDKLLYKEILKRTYPELFALKTKSNYGLGLNASKARVLLQKGYLGQKYLYNKMFTNEKHKPTINYIDFSKAIVSKKDYKKLVIDNIQDLNKRGIIDWIDINSMIKDHFNNKNNYGLELILLTALEINIKAKNT